MSNRLKKIEIEEKKSKTEKQIKDALRHASRKGTKRRERKKPLDLICNNFPGGWKTLQILGYTTTLEIEKWEPKGKSKTAMFRSLIDYLMVTYPPPSFMYRIFYKIRAHTSREDMDNFGRLFKYLANGGSLRKVVGTELMPVPLTKKMCHEFMNLPSHTANVVAGVRTVQVKIYDGSPSLCDAIIRSSLGTFKRDEEFWATVIQWFCNQTMLDNQRIGPLVDYIQHCRNENHNFSMKGRSPLALIRNMEEWHGILHRLKGSPMDVYEESGLLGGTWITKKIDRQTGFELKHTWTFKELTSAKELTAEGRAMRHCVYSYSRSVGEGRTSIWSVRKDNERVLTIEVDNHLETIRQVRGFGNRLASKEEASIIRKWAAKNQLGISAYGFAGY